MSVDIIAVGGYDEIGSSMTAVKIDDVVLIIDMGMHVDKIAAFGERENINNIPIEKLYEIEAIPDDRILEKHRDKVKAILISHGHLDHVGSAHLLSAKYNAPIYGTPFTVGVLESLAKDAKIEIPNDIKKISPNSEVQITNNISVRFVNVTHSIPQSSIIDIRTKYGHIVYACDFKFDNFPIVGKRSNYNLLREIGREGVKSLIVETTRADEDAKANSEIIAKYMLYDVLSSIDTKGVIVTTFASHIARLKSIVDISHELGRTPIFIGRSLHKYIKIAEDLGFVDFSNNSEIWGFSRDFPKVMRRINENKEEYLLIVTGHQGEPGSVLDRMAKDQLHFDFNDTTVIFSNIVIPYPINEANRKLLEERLRRKGAHIIKDVHVSGHAKKEDHRMLIKMLNPENIFPTHGDLTKRAAYTEISEEFGYTLGENIFLLQNGQKKTI